MAAGRSMKQRFAERLEAADGTVYFVKSPTAAGAKVQELVKDNGGGQVALDEVPYLRSLAMAETLAKAGVRTVPGSVDRLDLAACTVGITSADYAIADSGTLAFCSAAGNGARSTSLLPPVHIAVVPISALVEDLVDVLERVVEDGAMPSCLTLVTGPSRTADIEQVLTIGVHGPGALHVILVG